MLKSIALSLLLLLPHVASADMVAMDDDALGAIQGKQGIAMDLQMALNANPATNSSGTAWISPSTLLTSGTTYGGPNPALTGTGGTTNGGACSPGTGANAGDPCYVALSFAGRANQWLAFKDSYFDMVVSSLHLDVGALKNDTTGTGYFNANVFQNLAASGTQCAFGSGNCTTTTINSQHALQLSFHCPTPSTATSTCQASTMPSYSGGISTGYTDLMLSLSIGRMAVEFTAAGSGGTPVTAPTYTTDSNGSFIGLAIHDNNSYFAGAYIGGRAYVSGF